MIIDYIAWLLDFIVGQSSKYFEGSTGSVPFPTIYLLID